MEQGCIFCDGRAWHRMHGSGLMFPICQKDAVVLSILTYYLPQQTPDWTIESDDTELHEFLLKAQQQASLKVAEAVLGMVGATDGS